MIKVSPSILSADFANLAADCRMAVECGADWLHIDVMDGHFVPNISLGLPVVKSLRKVSDAFFDVHLMISDPETYAPQFIDAGADLITFHIESCSNAGDVLEVIDLIRAKDKKVGLSVKPFTPAEAVFPYLDKLDMVLVMSVEPGFGGQKFMPARAEKIAKIREFANKNGMPDLMIEVDGGINGETGRIVTDAGADVLVAGSYVFGKDREAMTQAIQSLKK